ncbi:hypothetical protein ASF21_14460 [Arthrobacter sp. Leaf234]|nr:hypothetical protein ASF21_14460 [Arthrobacter sp. Leaf234]
MHNRRQPETGEPLEPRANSNVSNVSNSNSNVSNVSNVSNSNSNVTNIGDEHSTVRRHRQQQLRSTPVVPAAADP